MGNGARNVEGKAHGAHEKLTKTRQINVGNTNFKQDKFRLVSYNVQDPCPASVND